MRLTSPFLPLALLLLGGLSAPAPAAKPVGPAYTDPAKTDDDFAFQGEYSGAATIDGQALRLGIQVVALGDGKFDLVAYPGGLPGDGWTPPEKMQGGGTRQGTGKDAVVVLEGGRAHARTGFDGHAPAATRKMYLAKGTTFALGNAAAGVFAGRGVGGGGVSNLRSKGMK